MERKRIELTIDTIKTLWSGATDSSNYTQIQYFYLVKDLDGVTYTINTYHKLYSGDKIVASIKGMNVYQDQPQIKLTRVTIKEPNANRPKAKSTYIGNLISTDGEYY